MKRILIILFILITSIQIISSDDTTYRDVSKEHWAYYSIENLINKGILEVDSDYFNGEVKTTKNDLVYYLSKVLNKLDETKADKDDLLIIENLIYEFSNELNEFGMDIENYKSKIDRLQNNIEPTNEKIKENERKIAKINEMLKKTDKNTEKSIKNPSYNNFGNVSINFRSELIKNNLKKDSSEQEDLKYKKDYELQLKYSLDQGEILLSKISQQEIDVNAKGRRELSDNLEIGFHLGDYITDISSYSKTLNYNNYDLDKNRFSSNNIAIESDIIKIYSEEKNDRVELLLDLNTKYLKSYYQRNFEDVLNNYELSIVYPELENYNISISYVNEEKKEEENKKNYKYALSQIDYSDKKKKFKIGYEHKIENEAIYNNFFGKADYEVIEGSYLGYELEILDTPINSSFLYNNKIKLENITENSNIRFEINKIRIEKEDVKLGEEDIHKYEYMELIAKLKYNIKEKYGIKMSYLDKTMQESKDRKTITYIMPYYKINEDIEIYIKYMEKKYDMYNDIKKNIDGDYYNMNFDREKGIIQNGDMVSLGIDMKF
ncbi:MAG: hypothetical protein ACQERZ_04400 [Fusobacteriota bacterium]